jgi:hypothetical protein
MTERRMTGRRLVLGLAAAAAMATLALTPALAQFSPEDTARGVNVRNRPRPEYDPLGMRIGTFVIRPQLRLDTAFDDNVLASGVRRESDVIQRTTGQVEARSDWGRHGLSGLAVIDDRRYLENPDESYLNYRVQGTGRYDITRFQHVDMQIGAARLHQERDDPNDFGSSKPIGIDERFVRAGYYVQDNRAALRVDALLNTLRYDDADFRNPATGITSTSSQAFRNRDLYVLSGAVSYELAPLRRALVVTRVNKRTYVDEPVSAGSFTRDSKGIELLAGLDADYDGIFSYRLLLGYLRQEYDAANLPTTSAPTGEALLLWNVTTLTTVSFRAERRVEESIRTNASSYLRSFGTVAVDHEYDRNILLNATLSYRLDEFEGISREDKTTALSLGATWLVNQNVRLGATYTRVHGDLGGGRPDYDRNVFLLRLQGAL